MTNETGDQRLEANTVFEAIALAHAAYLDAIVVVIKCASVPLEQS